MSRISDHLDIIYSKYTQDEYYGDMKQALDDFIEKTGKMNEESEEYESRMNSFNDWFIFNFKLKDDTRVIDQYLVDQSVDEEIAKAFHNLNYSLFLFQKINLRKQIVIKDVLHNKKIVLAKESSTIALVEDDMFIGRTVELDAAHHLLNGICILPRNVYSILKKESKKIRKLNNAEEEEKYLLNLENLKTKSLQYGHVNSEKIFTFS